MQTLFLMRYSYFGSSGWQSPTSKDKSKLLSADRLAKRFDLFRKITLPSLAAQSDGDFKLVILSSAALPNWRKRQLTELCKDTLGDDRAHLAFRRPAGASLMFRKYIKKRLTDVPFGTQVVLDDDDAVSTSFVATLRKEAQTVLDMHEHARQHSFLSFPRGLSLVLQDDGARLFHRMMPFTNLGLSLVGPTNMRKNVYGIAHKKVADHNNARVIYSNTPTYIRTCHDQNDSRAWHSEQEVSPDHMPAIMERFPMLQTFFPHDVAAHDGLPLAA